MAQPERQDLEKMKEVSHHEDAGLDGEVVLFDENGAIRKIPTPSKSPNDPLNFSFWRQSLLMGILSIYGITAFGIIQSTPLYFDKLIPHYIQETHGQFDPNRINLLASYSSLLMGIGNFFFVPISLAFGRRFAFLVSNALMIGSTVWAAQSTTFESHLGARCLQGLSGGVSDCLLPIIIIDISFLHQRGTRLTTYWAATAIGSSILLAVAPSVVKHAGGDWRVNYYFFLAFSVFTFVLALAFFPETLFDRPATALNGRILVTDAYGTVHNFASAEQAHHAGFTVTEESADAASTQTSRLNLLSPINLQTPNPIMRILHSFKDIFLCLLIPGTLWALILNSLLFAAIVILSLYYSRILAAPPYLFADQSLGTVQVGAAIGALVSLIFMSLTAERAVEWQTRRNGGIREPEFNLINFVVPSIAVFGGLVLYGVVAGNPTEHSWIGIHAGFALYYFGFTAISAVTSMWVAELLPTWSGPAIVLCSGGRNAISFGMSYSFDNWVDSMGFQSAHIMLGGLMLAVMVLGIPVYLFNRHLRRITSELVAKLG